MSNLYLTADFNQCLKNYEKMESYASQENEEGEEEKGPALEIYGTDLTVLAAQGQLDECFGREKELSELMQILARRQKNNPVLVGDAGVGKTAIIELFASKIVNNLVPFVLEGRTIISIDLARIVAGSRYRGEFESRFQRVLDEALDQPHIIIFIDEVHNISGAGSAEGSLDAANILKPALSRSGFQCIGATTTKEYQRIEKDPALNRRFQPIQVQEPSVENTVHILYGLRPTLEAYHNVEIMPGALRLAADLASRYISERFLPDKAIDLVDRAAAKAVIKLTNVTQGSVISGIANAGLNNIGTLRIEAFRRGDIPSEFIFQELENGYRNFLLKWIENPLSIPESEDAPKSDEDDEDSAPLVLSPISQSLFDTMRKSVLRRVDQLLFSSTHIRSVLRPVQRIKDLSSEKNELIFEQMESEMPSPDSINLSVYRISLFLYVTWLEDDFLTKKQKHIVEMFSQSRIFEYLSDLRNRLVADPFCYSREKDFCVEDIEEYEKSFDILSQLEQNRIEIFKDFLKELKPLLRKGMIESLKSSSHIVLSEEDLTTIYALLGYFSTETGREFLSNMDDPELIRRARKVGNFGILKKRIFQKDIRELLAEMTGIPVNTISSDETEKLAKLEETLHERVIGQHEAISAISKAIQRARLGVQNPNRPIASFMFCGPTGVGKTEVTKALAAKMFGSENDMLRYDMSEFMEKFAVSRLIGSPPGYIGYEEGGQLTDAVRKKPYSVVLFDEVEKAHPDILTVLLQILEDGRLTDSQKRLVSFENTIIIMTSNAAATQIQEIIRKNRTEPIDSLEFCQKVEEEEKAEYDDSYVGLIKFLRSPITEEYFTDLQKRTKKILSKSLRNLKGYGRLDPNAPSILKIKDEEDKAKAVQTAKELKDSVIESLNEMFLPEFLNRLDDIIVFQPLQPSELRKICEIMIETIIERLKPKQITLYVKESVKTILTMKGYNPLFGARPLRRLITKHIEDLVSEKLLKTPSTKRPLSLIIMLDVDNEIIIRAEDEEIV